MLKRIVETETERTTSDERRNSLHLILIQGLTSDIPVSQSNLIGINIGLERNSVLHPFLVVSIGNVITGVST